jgi:hypothetical protein
MLREPRFDIGSNPRIEASVGAFDEIQEPGHGRSLAKKAKAAMPRIIPQASVLIPFRTKSRDFGENNCSALHQAPGTQPKQVQTKPEAR